MHDGSDEFKWENGDAESGLSKSQINSFLWLEGILYLIFAYFTLINYSHFVNAKTWSDYSNYTLA